MPRNAQLNSRAEAVSALERVRVLQVERDRLAAAQEALLLKVKTKCGPGIEAAEAEIAELSERLGLWAVANRRSEFGDEQSLELPAGWLRFRQGQRKLLLRAKWSWEDVLQAMIKGKAKWGRYLRRDPDVDKARILADTRNALLAELDGDMADSKSPIAKGERQDVLDPALLAGVGIKISQEETFSVEVKAESS